AIVSKIEEIQRTFRVELSVNAKPIQSANISAGKMALIITQQDRRELINSIFGFTPAWADKPKYVLNARAEGDHNKENLPFYTGAKGILEKPFFRNSIRNKRCVVIADAFFEGPSSLGLSKPYCVFPTAGKIPMAFAGIYDEWQNKITQETLHSFAIITSAAASDVLIKIGHPRCPIALSEEAIDAWLNPNTPLADITHLLHPISSLELNAYPVGNEIKSPHADGSHLLKPIGDALLPEKSYQIHQHIELFGMGESRAKQRKNNDQTRMFDDL
ncbi:MAG: SOS response-associated peptidase, partial [Bacteroidota bacterium]